MDGELVEGDSIAGVQNSFEKVVDDLSKLMRGSLVALITIDVHNRDIVEYLINDKTENKSDFNWQVAVHPCA